MDYNLDWINHNTIYDSNKVGITHNLWYGTFIDISAIDHPNN
ncbi:MAG: hypothetical protein QF842_03655 [Candidatus Marinimicrobia bacterium]|nr:hypothetical protein [Candidatus Neomarinimicrobiota bacterium]